MSSTFVGCDKLVAERRCGEAECSVRGFSFPSSTEINQCSEHAEKSVHAERSGIVGEVSRGNSIALIRKFQAWSGTIRMQAELGVWLKTATRRCHLVSSAPVMPYSCSVLLALQVFRMDISQR